MREGTPVRFVLNRLIRLTSLPSPPLLFIAFFTSHRSPLSERLEQASLTRELVQYLIVCGLLSFFQISLKNSDVKTTHITFRDCCVHFFRKPFSKYLSVTLSYWTLL